MDTERKQPLTLAYFSRSVVVEIATQRHIFDRHGLEVDTVPVNSSAHQFQLLRDGQCDLALTSPDNVAAYRGSEHNPLGQRLDVRMLLALDSGLGLSVMARAGISDLSELAGKVIGVDVPQSGFALALFGILSRAGLEAGTDYEVISLGSTPQRRDALADGRCDATLLNAGHDIAAELTGCRRLARVTDTYFPYLGAVLASTGPWVEADHSRGLRFVAAWLEAVKEILDPAQRAAIISLTAETLGLPVEAAERFYDVLISRREGLVPSGTVDRHALGTVLALRAERGAVQPGSDGTPAGFDGLVDNRLLTGTAEPE